MMEKNLRIYSDRKWEAVVERDTGMDEFLAICILVVIKMTTLCAGSDNSFVKMTFLFIVWQLSVQQVKK